MWACSSSQNLTKFEGLRPVSDGDRRSIVLRGGLGGGTRNDGCSGSAWRSVSAPAGVSADDVPAIGSRPTANFGDSAGWGAGDCAGTSAGVLRSRGSSIAGNDATAGNRGASEMTVHFASAEADSAGSFRNAADASTSGASRRCMSQKPPPITNPSRTVTPKMICTDRAG
jgi:hypothetical protein